MEYRTLADLSNLVRHNIWKIPHDIDLVVGIPRSGMLPANMIALYLNKRLTDIDSFIDGRIFGSGRRSMYIRESKIHKVLIVDDSVRTGRAITKAKDKLKPLSNKYNFTYFAPIVTTIGGNFVDIFCEVIDDTRIFEWNLFHHPFINNACLDIDGVLNLDPTIDDDGPIYSNFIENAEPLFLPTTTINTLISCRLEKYRNQTEEWLKRNKIDYNQLILLDMPNKATRVAWGKHGEYKGEYYKNSNNILFIESSHKQAITIANISHKPVICIETNELIHKVNTRKRLKRKVKTKHPRFYNLIVWLIKRIQK